MNENNKTAKRKRILTVVAVMVAICTLITAGLLLSACGGGGEDEKSSEESRVTGNESDKNTVSGVSGGKTSEELGSSPSKPETPGSASSKNESEKPSGNTVSSKGDSTSSSSSSPDDDPFYAEEPGTAPVYISPASLCMGDDCYYVADATGMTVYKMTPEGQAIQKVAFNDTVNKVYRNGESVYVLSGGLDGELHILDTDLKLKNTVKVGHTPVDIYINGNTGYVANRFSDSVSVIDLANKKVISEISVTREPICMAASGGKLYVGCHLPADSMSEKTVCSRVEKIDMATNKTEKSIRLVNGAQSIKGMAVSEDGSEIYITHLVSRYTYPTTQLDRGWINSNAFTVINTTTDVPVAFLLDEVETGAGNPWDVEVCGNYLVFSLSGTGELMIVEKTKLNSRITKIEAGKDGKISSLSEIVDHIEFLSGIQKRVVLGGEGARDIAVSGDTVYVAQYFSGNVVTVNVKEGKVTATHSLGQQPEATAERQGEIIWYSAKYCYQQWESCASCHPDGRADALNWDNMNDGIGNPKNTKSMIFSHRTPPVMITGIRDSAETAVRKGMMFIQFNVMEEGSLDAIDAYLKAMLPTPSPYLNKDGSYSEAAQRGKQLFVEVGCAACHPAPLYTDLKYHKSPYLGSDGSWEDRAFVTPTLVEIWRSAPYTYCGIETSMTELVKKFSNRALTEEEASDLATFVLSIGTVEELYGVEQIKYTDSEGNTGYNKLLPGSTVTELTVRKQKANVVAPVILITLYDQNGKVLFEKKYQAEPMIFNTCVSVKVEQAVPADLAAGGYLTVQILDGSDREMATPLKIGYNG